MAATTTRTASTTRVATVRKAKAPRQSDIRFALIARPAAGSKLFAYTSAWLTMSGLFDGAAIPKAKAVRLAGSAINYHINQMNMVHTEHGITLTAKGMAFFKERATVEIETMMTYMAVLETGEIDGELVKNKTSIVAI